MNKENNIFAQNAKVEKTFLNREVDKIIDEIKSSDKVQKLIEKYNVTEQEIITKLDLFIQVLENESLENDKDFEISFKRDEDGEIKRIFTSSLKRKRNIYKENFWLTNISVVDIEKDLKDLMRDNSIKNSDINKRYIDLVKMYKKNNLGFFLYGNNGVGKSTFLKSSAVTYAKEGFSVAFINIPIFQQHLMDKISEKKLNLSEIIEKLKKVDVLYLDDLGLEKKSDWFRDSVLLQVLENRYFNKKKTFFSSYFSINQLEEVYLAIIENEHKKAKNNLSEIEKLKVSKFINRIKSLSVEYEIKGEKISI